MTIGKLTMGRLLLPPLLLLILLASAPASQATEPMPESGFRPGNIVLLIPDFEMQARTTSEGLQDMIVASLRGMDLWAKQHDTDLSRCVIFLAARPEARVRTWTSCGNAPVEGLDRFVADQIQPSEIAPVTYGTVALSLVGADNSNPVAGMTQLPEQWQAILDDSKDGMDIESVIDLAWPQ